MIGGCRNAGDESRVQDLKDLCKHLAVDSNVEFKTNLSFQDLKKEMGQGMIGLHTMWNEHFGIGEAATIYVSSVLFVTFEVVAAALYKNYQLYGKL